jgi:hypothetical protein
MIGVPTLDQLIEAVVFEVSSLMHSVSQLTGFETACTDTGA